MPHAPRHPLKKTLQLAVLVGTCLALQGCPYKFCKKSSSSCSGTTPSDPVAEAPTGFGSPLVIDYSFETVVNARIPDASASHLDLSVTGCSLVPGKVGTALNCWTSGFANTEPLARNFAKVLADKGTMSLQFWFNYVQNDGLDFIVYHEHSFSVSLQNNRIQFRPTYFAPVELATTLSPDTWYNLAITFDGATVKFYLDGALVQSESFISAIGDGAVNDTNLKIAPVFWEGHYYGAIDNLRIYDTVITADAVQASFGADVAAAGT